MPDEAGSEEAVCALEVCHGVWPSLPPSKATFTPPLRQKMDEKLFFPFNVHTLRNKGDFAFAFDTHLSDVEQYIAEREWLKREEQEVLRHDEGF